MKEQAFVLNNRFKIDPARRIVADTVLQKEIRLENRLMDLLLLLCNNAGELVALEMITKEIWNDYGNSDESLTQAISYLRKVLDDDPKKLIETIPKKGYILYAEFKIPDEPLAEVKTNASQFKWRQILIFGSVLLILAAGYFILRFSAKKPSERNPDIVPTET